jgi:hypothetical protein
MQLKHLLLAAMLAFSGAAFAGSCPLHMKQIDAALMENPSKLSAEKLAEAKRHRAEGEALHKAGKHQESVAELQKAKQMLGI